MEANVWFELIVMALTSFWNMFVTFIAILWYKIKFNEIWVFQDILQNICRTQLLYKS